MENKLKVPYLNLAKTYKILRPDLQRAFFRVIDSGITMLGKETKSFEARYAKFSSTRYAVCVGNGLDALTISLRALGISAGDEVIVPSNTYIATLVAVSRLGAIPVLVEPKIDTYNIDPNKIEEKITKKTKAIIPVHLFGQACEMDKIQKIAKKYKLFIVEDNAQAHGAKYNKKSTGSFGDLNATSFYPGKNLGAIGDAGAITTNNKEYAEKVMLLRNYGEKTKYVNEIIGYNSRTDELQAAFLNLRLKSLSQYNKRKNIIANIYLTELNGVGDIILPKIAERGTHVYHVFCIRTKFRDKLKIYLEKNGITTLIHYPIPPHLQKAYNFLGFKKGSFPIAEELADTSLSLPIYPEMTLNEIKYVIKKIKEFYYEK
jgi:dTDP-4-amino-4,6-dideoxygalactose transaminase